MQSSVFCLKSDNGFTLLETLVAVIVLSSCIVLVMQVFSFNLKTLPSSEKYIRAVFFARSLMEEVLLSGPFVPGKTQGRAASENSTGLAGHTVPGESDESAVADADAFSWEITITGVPPDSEGEKKDLKQDDKSAESFDLFRIDLRVMWGDRGKEKAYEISTMATKKG